jgi:hypothetical protein
MIDVDRPSIEIGMQFFQSYFDGNLQNSPNKINYLFFPLYRKSYSEDERKTIICDNIHHTDVVNVVAMTGLKDLATVVNLNQGIQTTIRHLLLVIPTQGTRTNKLFLQIERQPTNQWLLCCFYTNDTTRVTLCLSSLEKLTQCYVKQEDHSKLFSSSDFTLKFNGQAAPIKNGRGKKITQEAPEETVQYAENALKKLHTPAPKRLAVEFDQTEEVTTNSLTPVVSPVIRQTNPTPPPSFI